MITLKFKGQQGDLPVDTYYSGDDSKNLYRKYSIVL